MGQCAELSQWKPLFLCPVRMSQMIMACGSSFVSISGLKVTTYLEGSTTLMSIIVWNQEFQFWNKGKYPLFFRFGEKKNLIGKCLIY